MKALKRLAVFVVALLMAFMSVLFVACDGGLGGSNGGNGTTGGNTGEITGGNENKPASEVVATALDNLTKQKLSSITGSVAVTPSKYEEKDSRDEGKTVEYLFGDQNMFDANIIGNYSGGEMDLVLKAYSGKKAGSDNDPKHNYLYMFMRDWDVFTDATIEETAPADCDLYNDGHLTDDFGLKPDYIEKMARFNHLFVYLANATDSVTVSGNTMTVDLNKTLYGVVSSFKKTINALKPSMTIGELLRDEAIKNLLSATVNMITPQDAVKIALDNLSDNADIKEIADIVAEVLDKVEIDDGSTTYDYLLKLIASDDVYDVLSEIVEEQMGIKLPAKLDSITLDFVMDNFNVYATLDDVVKLFDETKTVTDFASMKEGLNFIVEEVFGDMTQDTVVFNLNIEKDKIHVEVSKAKIVYQLTDGKITSMHVEGEYKQHFTFTYHDYDSVTDSMYEYTEETILECTAIADIDFAAQKQTVAEIVLPQD